MAPAELNEASGAAAIAPRDAPAAEPRWPVALTVVLLLTLLATMPHRLRLLPPWALLVVAAGMLVPLAAAALRHRPAARIERLTTLAFVALGAFANLVTLKMLIEDIVGGAKDVGGLELLASSVAVWITNVVVFALLYWQMDRGGPAGRETPQPAPADWVFAQDQGADASAGAGWRPWFLDYLFLAYSTATAFSTTDALPLTGRAKLAMMAESTVSLLTLVVVAARAINVLGA